MKKILSLIIGVMVLAVTFLGALQVSSDINNSNVSLFQTSLKLHSKIFLGFYTIIDDIGSIVNSKKTNPVDTKEKNNKTLSVFLFALSAILINKKINLVILVMLILTGCCIYKKTIFSSDDKIPDIIKGYLLRMLRFITPVNKCILNRADQYDINPISIVVNGIIKLSLNLNRALSKKFKARFF